jgi:anti-anti-sigma regulatory factor
VTDASDDRWGGDAGPVATRIGSALVVTLPREVDDATLAALRSQVLERARRGRIRALVFEASGLDVIDAVEFRGLAGVARGANWLGVRPMLVGLSAGIVRYLVDVAADTSDFEPFGTLDDALAALAWHRRDDVGGADGDGDADGGDADGGAPHDAA